VRAVDDLRLLQLRRKQFVSAVQGCSRSRDEAEALLGRLRHVPAQRPAGSGG
jgi:hypothetical protein